MARGDAVSRRWSGAACAVLLAAAGAGRAAPAASDTDLQAYARLPVCTLSADGRHLAVEPCRTAPARKPMPRRPVTQIIQRMPVTAPPRAITAPPLPPTPTLQELLQPPRSPIPVAGCDAGGCYDASGARHNNAASGVTITPSGKLCNRNGTWLQCQ
jgi:hypothetical protein